MANRRHLLPIALAAAATVPGIAVRLTGLPLSAPVHAAVAGAAIMGAAFLLLWACDAVQVDVSQALSLALVALIAVLPEYAVDMYFTWQAGKHPELPYAQYSIANMTGANRLLIGVAWVAIVGVFWAKTRKPVQVGPDRRTELLFLLFASVYAVFVAAKGSLVWYDGLALMAIYAAYMRLTSRRPAGEADAHGPAEMLVALPTRQRRLATWAMFGAAAGAIALNAEPFSEALIATGSILHISKFVLVQWLAPVASEAPEFIVAIVFALRAQGGMALGSLLSAQLNQWTLLVGMIPLVYGLAHGSFGHPIPMSGSQMQEVLLTAAQSLLGVVMLASLRLSLGQAILLFALFAGQLAAPAVVAAYSAHLPLPVQPQHVHQLFSLMYVTAALALFFDQPRRVLGLRKGLIVPEPPEELSPERRAAALLRSGKRCAAGALLAEDARDGVCATCSFHGVVCAGR